MKLFKEEIIEQLLHFLWTAIALLPVCLLGEWWAAALSAFLFVLPREFIDQWPINKWWNIVLDLLFFTLGGAAVGMILLL